MVFSIITFENTIVNTIAVLLLDGGALKVAGVYGEKDTLAAAVIDGFCIALADVFRA